jgi:hypothetical protein
MRPAQKSLRAGRSGYLRGGRFQFQKQLVRASNTGPSSDYRFSEVTPIRSFFSSLIGKR